MQEPYARQYLDLWRNHWWWRARHRLVLRRLDELAGGRTGVEPPLRILDIGCCGGVAFDDWSRYGDVWGIEPDPRLAVSTPRWTNRVTPTSLRDYDAPPESFDLVIMLDVLEHIEDDAAALQRVAALLRPGGRLLLTVPALMMLWSAHDEVNSHFRRYDRKGLVERIRAAGLEPVRSSYFFTWSFKLLLLRRFLSRRAPGYRVRVPARPINVAFEALSRLENRIFGALRVSPPFGSSLLAVAARPRRP